MKNVAVIGYGGQGAWHCHQLMASDVCTLAGTYDIREVRRAAAEKDGVRVYESNEAIFADPAVDLVVVAVPNDLHRDLVISALEAGKNVVCEKPVALSLKELDEMIEASKRTGKLFTVHQNRRWDVDFLAMKSLRDSGEIGKVLNLESRIEGSRGIPSDWRCHKPQGGGMILDWGVHLIDQMLQIMREKITSVYCTCTHYTNDEVDDGFRLVLTFADASTALVEVGTYNFLRLPRFYMQAEKGTAVLTNWRNKAHVAYLKLWQEKDVTPVQNAAGITKTMAPRDEETLREYDVEIPISDVHDFYRNVCRAIDGEEEQLIKLPEVRRVVCVMEAAFESDRTGQVVKTEI